MMTRFFAFVLISPDVVDVDAKVKELLAPYSVECEVEPYRDYFSEEEIQYWAGKFGTGDDLPALLNHVHRELSARACLDDRGIYEISTWNPDAEWDYWSYSGGKAMLGEQAWAVCLDQHSDQSEIENSHICNSCLVADLPTPFVPAAIVTSDGVWHDLRDFGGESNPMTLKNWGVEVHKLLQDHANHLAVGINCHV